MKPGTVQKRGQLVKTDDSEVYNKWSQALASSYDLISHAVHQAKAALIANESKHFAVLPLLVIPDHRLWEVEYDDAGAITAEPAMSDACTLYVDHVVEASGIRADFNFTISHLHILTLSGLRRFLQGLCRDGLIWDQLFAI